MSTCAGIPTCGGYSTCLATPECGVCVCLCHANPICDAVHDVFDLVKMAGVAFRNQPASFDGDCPAPREDVDCDGVVNVFDVVRMVNVAFKNDPPSRWFCEPCKCSPYPTNCP